MKTKLFLLVAILNLGIASAQTFTVDGIKYTVIDGTTTVRTALNQGKKGVVTIPASVEYYSVSYTVTTIGSLSFSFGSQLTSVILPSSITSIEHSAFALCPVLKTIIIPDAVTSIEHDTFNGCRGLTNITIPEAVTSIGANAFYYCEELTSIIIPNAVTSIGNDAFGFCTSITSLVIPNSVTTFGDGAFSYCSGLESITIPNSITSIGNNVFVYTLNLSSLTIPDSVISLGNYAFWFSGLTSISIPNSVTSIGDYAFSESSKLSSVTIPKSVTSIGIQAFAGCTSLTTFNCNIETPLAINPNVFENANQGMCALNVPTTSVSLYQAADVWKDFPSINVLSTENFTNKNRIKLYPNPVQNELFLELNNISKANLEIVDINGKVEFAKTVDKITNSIDTSNLATGLYFVKLNSNEGTITKKLIKN